MEEQQKQTIENNTKKEFIEMTTQAPNQEMTGKNMAAIAFLLSLAPVIMAFVSPVGVFEFIIRYAIVLGVIGIVTFFFKKKLGIAILLGVALGILLGATTIHLLDSFDYDSFLRELKD